MNARGKNLDWPCPLFGHMYCQMPHGSYGPVHLHMGAIEPTFIFQVLCKVLFRTRP